MLKQGTDLAALNKPVGLENVDDANVDQQPLSFRITRWNTAHAEGRRQERQ